MRITIVVTDELEPDESWSEFMSGLDEKQTENVVLNIGTTYALGGRIESWSVA